MRRLPILISHRPGCTDFPLPVLHGRDSLAEVQMTTIRDLPAKNDAREDVRLRFHSCQFSYPLSFRGQVCETQRSLPCFPSTVLSARHPAFLDRSRSVRFPDVTGTIEVPRLPATHIRSLICFASG